MNVKQPQGIDCFRCRIIEAWNSEFTETWSIEGALQGRR